jgi:uncharacterized protein with GYD domain
MATFLMFGKYTPEALKKISADRTKEAQEIIKKNKGKIISMYALLGETDLVFIVDLPSTEAAVMTSIALNKLTGISFTTHQAMSVEAFDKLID